ncbi:YlxR family protein [Geminocystis sp. GBBB08]|uniref:YlxR family protein n=1 Tax=Geminocystis sp. GBBB08 TaxID=2604140 RepID=UPI0027E2A3C0|nr:YlxR family protein [Geminocystis sp. GBBB08]MBL1211617.1 YlxR family protein [Geminocystis sp. GBBB08]
MNNPNKHKNYRRCISCHRLDERKKFWRIVRTYPEKKVILDQGMGRSAYLCPQLECLNLAKKKKRLSRALKAEITAEIYEQLTKRLL